MLRMGRLIVGLIFVAICGAGMTGCGSAANDVTTEQPGAADAPRGAAAEVPSDPNDIVALAREAGQRSGDGSPTDIEWVYSGREAAVLHVSDTHLADAEDVDVLVIQMQGDFEVTTARPPPPAEGEEPFPNPTGRALVVVADLDSGIMTDRMVLPQPVDLRPLGEVVEAP